MDDGIKVFLLIVYVIFAIIFGPWIFFWAINVLSTAAGTPVVIPFTLKTWFAGVLFMGSLRGGK